MKSVRTWFALFLLVAVLVEPFRADNNSGADPEGPENDHSRPAKKSESPAPRPGASDEPAAPSDCARIHKARTYYLVPGFGRILVEHEGETITEHREYKKFFIKSKLTWVGSCEYTVVSKITHDPMVTQDSLKDSRCVVRELTDYSYTSRCTRVGEAPRDHQYFLVPPGADWMLESERRTLGALEFHVGEGTYATITDSEERCEKLGMRTPALKELMDARGAGLFRHPHYRASTAVLWSSTKLGEEVFLLATATGNLFRATPGRSIALYACVRSVASKDGP